jgi:hypothetical protein
MKVRCPLCGLQIDERILVHPSGVPKSKKRRRPLLPFKK